MTPQEIIAHRRRRVIELAGELGNVAAACRQMGVSRTSFYRWANRAARYGTSALTPKPRRRPVVPGAFPPETVEAILAEALARPTLGARQLVGYLAERGIVASHSGVQKILRRHNLASRAQRVRAMAQITAATTGLVTRDGLEGPFGFCHFAANPGDLVALDSFYIGRLKGIGAVWQLTGIDTHTRFAVVALVIGHPTAHSSIRFIDHLRRALGRVNIELRGVLTDNGPEWIGRAFQDHLTARGITHQRTPPRSPDHNAVCERFQGIALEEFHRPAFHRQRFDRIVDLDAQLQAWVHRYNTRRHNHGDYMRGRTPAEMLRQHERRTTG
jgi:transposase InsO family protein